MKHVSQYVAIILISTLITSTTSNAMLSKEASPSKVKTIATKSNTPVATQQNNARQPVVIQQFHNNIKKAQEDINKTYAIFAKIAEETSKCEIDIEDLAVYDNLVHRVGVAIAKLDLTDEIIADIDNSLFDKNLDLNDTRLLHARFVLQLTSGLKYIKDAHEKIHDEYEKYLCRPNQFSKRNIFAHDIVSFAHPSRKELILRLHSASQVRIPDALIKLAKLLPQDPTTIKGLLQLYKNLIYHSLISVKSESLLALPDESNKWLRNKSLRLMSTLFDGETETMLAYSELLLPYVVAVQNVLNIDEYDALICFADVINDALEQQRSKTFRRPLFSREKVTQIKMSYEQESNDFVESFSTTSDAQDAPSGSTRDYRDPSCQEIRKRQKLEKKEAKRAMAEANSKGKEREEKKEVKSRAKPVPVVTPVQTTVSLGGRHYKTFEKIMDGTYRGTINKVVALIEHWHGVVDDGRSGSRMKIELPHRTGGVIAVADMHPPEEEMEEDVAHGLIHKPHKNKSNKLRAHHTEEIRMVLLKADYSMDTVCKSIPGDAQ